MRCIDEELPFEVPDSWAFVRLKEIWELISGRDLSPSEYNASENGIPYITGASNFINGSVELVRWTPSPQVITEYGDLLLTCKGTIGEMAINDFGSAHIARQIMAISGNKEDVADIVKDENGSIAKIMRYCLITFHQRKPFR